MRAWRLRLALVNSVYVYVYVYTVIVFLSQPRQLPRPVSASTHSYCLKNTRPQ